MAKLVSKVYGDALFSLAVEENRVDELWDETRAMKQVLSENPDFMAILEHPEMTMEKKMDVLQEVFQKELSQDMMCHGIQKDRKSSDSDADATIGETKKEN